MRIHFDPSQEYQLDAIRAVADLFAGQPSAESAGTFELADVGGLQLSELGLANHLSLAAVTLLENVSKVAPIPTDDRVYTVEMETGTGKTYVYLRTIFELHQRYGWKKFIIVVPSVAIREGVLASIKMVSEHLRGLYDAVPFETWVYDSAQASRLRSFATSDVLQILILNIQAFDKKDINVIHQEQDRMSGYRPRDFIQSARPIVILDEPQNMTSDKRKDAIESLNPLFELRYSATHREVINLVYRLDPVRAYDLGLVKRIEVSSVLDDPDFNRPYVRLISIKSKPKFVAKLELDVSERTAVFRKEISISDTGLDLYDLSGRREVYRGWIIDELDAGEGLIRFSNGVTIRAGEAVGIDRDAIMRAQIHETIKQHFDKERSFSRLAEGERMKVLSLFFIDRVANYLGEDAKIRRWFEDLYQQVAADYTDLSPAPVATVHGGYFASDKHGPKDTTGKSKADDEAYELIMRDKERLLSLDEPLRFIFSHSALREGWDNPNVFQICTLNETQSEVKKRQELGRGLRLPVRADGTRCFDEARNKLTVVANESYEEFAKGLQTELREDCGVEFGERVKNAREKKTIQLTKGFGGDLFQELWSKIQPRTRYRVQFDTATLISTAAQAIAVSAPIRRPRVAIFRGRISLTALGVVSETSSKGPSRAHDESVLPLPDLLGFLQRQTNLTRATLAEILIASGRLSDAYQNPQQFLTQAADCINRVLTDLLIRGIEYEKIADQTYEQRIFEDAEIETYLSRLIPVSKSIYDAIEVDSEVERQFAKVLDGRDDIKLFFKLPRGFKVETPIGTYNPDWAIIREDDTRLYLIRETKGSLDPDALRPSEAHKIACGAKHFAAVGVDFAVAKSAAEV